MMEKGLIDLHTHTCYSDGELTPDELLLEAISKNMRMIAITDHDTIDGLKNITINYQKMIELIPGIELTAKVMKGRMHILGYGIDIHNYVLNNVLSELRDNSLNSILALIVQLKKDYNISFTYDEIKELVNANHNLGRPDLAKLCIKHGYAENFQEAFDKYLIDAYSKVRHFTKGLTPSECIKLIIESGGIPVLAHPYTLELSDQELYELVKQLIDCGLEGIEVYHSKHSKDEREKYLELACELNLLMSGGTDYHGSIKPDVKLGTGRNDNVSLKEVSLVKKLNRR